MRYSLPVLLLRKFVLLPSYTLVLLIRLLKWLIAPPALLLQLLIGTPLTLLRIRQPLRPHFRSLQDTDLPDSAWIALTDATEALAAEGFVPHGDFRCDDLIHEGTLWLRFLSQRNLGVAAMAAHVETSSGLHQSHQFVEFSTEFCDGRVLNTTNLDLPYSLPQPSYLARVQLKDVWDPRALFALHQGLVVSLAQKVSLDKLERAARDPAGLLADDYVREIQTLMTEGWLKLASSHSHIRLRPWAALIGVWRQAWPLQILHLRAADRRSRRLLAKHGLDADQFTGGAITILVSRPSPAPPTAISGVVSGFQHIQPLVCQTDPNAVLEAVTVELDHEAASMPVPREFRYSFRAYHDQPKRRICRLHGFDILLDPATGASAVTAMEREFEQAANDAAWAKLAAIAPLTPLRLNAWLCDLDRVLPAAQTALAARPDVKEAVLDSASLYLDHEMPRWQVIAWADDADRPLAVALDARSGVVLKA